MMQKIFAAASGLLVRARAAVSPLWRRFRLLPLWAQLIIGAVVLVLVLALLSFVVNQHPKTEASLDRTVSVRSVAELEGSAAGVSVIGTVRAHAEAELVAEASGMVKSVQTTLGATVPAGFVLAALDNSTESAAVLQAEGAYEAALASRAAVSPVDTAVTAQNAYKNAYSTLDIALTAYLDALFGMYTPSGPSVKLTTTQTDRTVLSRERVALATAMDAWQGHLASADTTDPGTLLDEAERVAGQAQTLAEELARSANVDGSGATSDQLSALATARGSINTVLGTLASARTAWRSGSQTTTASVDASVKSALGVLNLARANYEKTIIRAPIGGTVNFLPIRVGDYVSLQQHVATVAQNGALEVVAYVSDDAGATLVSGDTVTIEDNVSGVITSVAPALDPVTKQREVDIAVTSAQAASLVNGQSVRVTLPATASLESPTAGPVLLPLASVKLTAEHRVVFTVGSDGHLIAIPVTIGDVRGDKLEITSDLPRDTRIVSDARGLSEGQAVRITP